MPAPSSKSRASPSVTNNPDHEIIETTLLRGRVRLLQPKVGFHASIDTVFLAAAAPARKGDKILDVGCGVGSAGFCLMARQPLVQLTGLDAQQEVIDLALQNAGLNDHADRCHFFRGNLLHEKIIPDNHFNTVLMNPPYQEAGTHTPSPEKIKAWSHGEEASGATLGDWVKYAHRKLKSGGTLTLIHRADRADDVIAALVSRRWFGSLVLLPLMSHAGEDAKRIIIMARKERYRPMALKSGFVIHEDDGTYTKAAQKILSDAESLTIYT